MNSLIPENEKIRRLMAYLFGLFLMGLGIAFSKHGELGISPISSVPNVISEGYKNISFGVWLFGWNMVLILLQIIVLRSKFEKKQLLQIPLSLLFGIFTNVGSLIANRFPVEIYSFKWMSIVIGSIILALGISMTVVCDLILNAGEAAVKAISDTFGFAFGNVKVVFDISSVVLAIIVSLIMFDKKLVGIGPGTIYAAIATGFFVKLIIPSIREDLEKWITNKY